MSELEFVSEPELESESDEIGVIRGAGWLTWMTGEGCFVVVDFVFSFTCVPFVAAAGLGVVGFVLGRFGFPEETEFVGQDVLAAATFLVVGLLASRG